MAQPGTTPIAAPIDTYAAGNTYPTHFPNRGKGGFMTAADVAARDLIPTLRLDVGMVVNCLAEGMWFELQSDLTTWADVTPNGILPADVMLKCFHPNTEILTKDGWKYVERIEMSDEVMTLHPENFSLEYQKPTNLYEYEYSGELLGRRSKQIDYLVTPNHKFFVKQWLNGGNPYRIWKENYVWETADHFKDKIRSFPITGKWTGERLEEKFGIEGDLFIKFLAWFLSEGHTAKNRITISQVTKQDLVIEVVEEVAKSLGVSTVVYNDINFGFCHPEFAQYCKQFGTSKFKFVPQEIKNATSEQIRLFIDTYILGDGHESIITTISKQMADDLQELCLKAGWWASVSNDGATSGFNSQNELYRINVNKNNAIGSTSKKHNYKLDYDGLVFCLEVPNHIVYTRLNGRCVFSGNSTYDPNDDGSVINSDELQGEPGSYYLARANHTGTQAQSTIVNLVSDLAAKESTANKGATNGYAPLVGGVVPLANLPAGTPNLYLGLYDASTDTPAILNGTGSAGEFYIANVIGNAYAPVNVTIVNQIVAYDGAVWQVGAVFSGGIASVVTALGSQPGPTVTIDDTTYIDPSTDRNYVTDDQEDGLGGSSNPATATNYYPTKLDVESWIVGSSFFNFDLYNDGQTLGDGTSRLLNTLTNPATGLAYTNGSAGAVWTRVNSAYTINVATMTIDWIAGQEALLAMQAQGYSRIIDVGGRGYVPSQSWDLPLHQEAVSDYKRGKQFYFAFGGSKISNRSATPFQIFSKMPANQAQAAGSQLDYAFHFSDMFLQGIGSSNVADVGIHLGGTTGSSINKVEFAGFNTAANWIFCMGGTINDVSVKECINDGLVLATGVNFWTGAGTSTSQSNNNEIQNSRFYNGTSTTMRGAISILGSRNNNITGCGFEGHDGAQHVIYFNSQGSTNAYQIGKWSCIDFEEVGASTALMKIIANSGQLKLDTFAFTYANPSTDIPIALGISPFTPGQNPAVTVDMETCTNGAGAGVKYKQDGVCYWWVRNWGVNNNTTFNVAANFDLTGDGTLPDSTHVRFQGIIT